MLDAKITLTQSLIRIIKKARVDNCIRASDLSESIGRTVSYMSSVENGRIAKVASKDLIAIFIKIFGISEDEAVLKIEEMLSEQEDSLPCGNVSDCDETPFNAMRYFLGQLRNARLELNDLNDLETSEKTKAIIRNDIQNRIKEIKDNIKEYIDSL